MQDNIKKEILFGLLLGDANLQTYTGGKSWRIRFIQSDKNKDYLFYLYSIFQSWVKTPPKQSFLESGHSRWTFNTTVQPVALEFANMFYFKNKKVIPSNNEYLVKYLTPRALAFWFMDEGSLKSNCLSYYLCTDSFDLKDLKRIGEIVFKKKFDIDISFHKKGNNYRIYIPRKDSVKFRNLIEEYMHESMLYKLSKT